MNGRVCKAIRRRVQRDTVGVPYVRYVMDKGTIRMNPHCTRARIKRLKRAYFALTH